MQAFIKCNRDVNFLLKRKPHVFFFIGFHALFQCMSDFLFIPVSCISFIFKQISCTSLMRFCWISFHIMVFSYFQMCQELQSLELLWIIGFSNFNPSHHKVFCCSVYVLMDLDHWVDRIAKKKNIYQVCKAVYGSIRENQSFCLGDIYC